MDTLERWPSARQRESIPRPMELAIISDTHLPRGNRHLPPTCVEHLRRADLIIHAGDLRTLDVLAELESLGAEVAAIHGNVDEAAVRAQLPATRIVAAGGVRIRHHPGSPTERRRAPVHTMGLARIAEGRVRFELVELG